MKPQSSAVQIEKEAKVSPCRTPTLGSNSPDISPSTRIDDLVAQYRTNVVGVSDLRLSQVLYVTNGFAQHSRDLDKIT